MVTKSQPGQAKFAFSILLPLFLCPSSVHFQQASSPDPAINPFTPWWLRCHSSRFKRGTERRSGPCLT